jgi:hypothetical protein
VWPVQQKKDSNPEYWIGIELFWSSGTEFFLNHASDSIEYKKQVETICRTRVQESEVKNSMLKNRLITQ